MNTQPLEIYDSAGIKKLEELAIEEGSSGHQLMERAGRLAFDVICEKFSACSPILVLCGNGNNGGDGYVVARLLHRIGMVVSVARFGSPGTPEADSMCQSYIEAGGQVIDASDKFPKDVGLVVDALFGIGLTRPAQGKFAEVIQAINQADCPVVALDLPSGLSADTGYAMQPAVRADLTVTFIGRKLGQLTADGPDYCGELLYGALGLEDEVFRQVEPAARLTTKPELPPLQHNSHKGMLGHLVIAGGDEGMLGAVLLAGQSALRMGVGMVTVLSRESHLDRPALLQPELMSHSFETIRDGTDLLTSCDALVLGPGMVNNAWARLLFRAARKQQLPMVLDAGALRVLANGTDYYANQVLTPHPGEAAALLDCSSADIQRDRVQAAREISRRYGGTCILKGKGTIIAMAEDATATVRLCDQGNPGMATAGMGDVLSGVVGSLLARNWSTLDAACAGAWWHGRAADVACSQTGPYSMLASDVIASLPAVIH